MEADRQRKRGLAGRADSAIAADMFKRMMAWDIFMAPETEKRGKEKKYNLQSTSSSARKHDNIAPEATRYIYLSVNCLLL
jgi:hypothetical protein